MVKKELVYLGIFFLVFVCGIVEGQERTNKIGIYKAKGARIALPEPIINTLVKEGYEVEPVPSLELKNIAKYKVLIMPQCWSFPHRDKQIYFENLRSYVEDCGGGIIFYHDSVGYSRAAVGHIFPEIVKQAPTKHESFKMKVMTEHPVTKGYRKGQWVKHLYYDHVIMEPGKEGTVLFQDDLGGNVVVCGKVGRGKVVFNGTVIADPSDDPKQQVKIATGVDKDILINSIRGLLEGKIIKEKNIEEANAKVALKREERKKGRNYSLWQISPWYWSFTSNEKPPSEKTTLKKITVSLCENESEPVTFMIKNPGKETLSLRIVINDLKGISNGEKIEWWRHITIREAVRVRTRLDREMVPDALLKLNEGNIITIPPGETRQVWLNIASDGLKPIDYRTIISLNPLGMQKKEKIDLRIKVWNFRLPEDMPYVFLWDNELGRAPNITETFQKEFLKLLAKAGVNMFQLNAHKEFSLICDEKGNLLKKPDFSVWDKYIDWERKYAKIFIFRFHNDFRTPKGEKIAWLGPVWRKALKNWLTHLTGYFESKGLTYDDWALYLWDEYIGPKYIKLGKAIREINPKIKFFTTKLQPPQYLKEALPYIDIVSPHESFFFREDRKNDREMVMQKFREGRLVITTHTSGYGQKLYPPSFYRIKGWRSFAAGITGIGYWSVGSGYAGVFGDRFDTQPANVSTIYPTSFSCITSRRWEAFREGLEDYRYLYLLTQRIKKSSDKKLIKDAKEVMQNAVEEILSRPEDYSLYEKWRNKIAKAILKLK